MSADFENFLCDLIDHELAKVELGFVGVVVAFDKASMRATIKPLLRARTEEDGIDAPKFIDYADIDQVPVQLVYAGGCYIRPHYKPGDLVKLALAASSIQQPIDDRVRSDTLKDRFQLNYCTVSGAVLPEDFEAPASWAAKDGLIIGKDEFFMQFTDTGINVTGLLSIDGTLEATEDIVADGVSLKNHTHGFGYNAGPTPSAGNTNPPT